MKNSDLQRAVRAWIEESGRERYRIADTLSPTDRRTFDAITKAITVAPPVRVRFVRESAN